MHTKCGPVLLIVLGFLFAPTAPAPLRAAEPPLQLKWDQLVPPASPKPLKRFFGDEPVDISKPGGANHGGQGSSVPEGRWMSAPKSTGAGLATVVASLDGKRVHIGGYVVPLDFDAARVTEFLLVPFVGACIHVPPPPANQIVYVKAEKGFDVRGMFDPVWVTGILRVTPAFTGLAEAGYSLNADKVELRPQE